MYQSNKIYFEIITELNSHFEHRFLLLNKYFFRHVIILF